MSDTVGDESSVCRGCFDKPRCIERKMACEQRLNEVKGLSYRSKAGRTPTGHYGGQVRMVQTSRARLAERRELEASRPPPADPMQHIARGVVAKIFGP